MIVESWSLEFRASFRDHEGLPSDKVIRHGNSSLYTERVVSIEFRLGWAWV